MLQHGPPVSTCQYGSTFLLTTACITKSVSEQGRFGGLSAVVSSFVSAYWKPRTIAGCYFFKKQERGGSSCKQNGSSWSVSNISYFHPYLGFQDSI